MDERLKFVARLLDGEQMTALCREFGISRKTGYKIYNRYKEIGLDVSTPSPPTANGRSLPVIPKPTGPATCVKERSPIASIPTHRLAPSSFVFGARPSKADTLSTIRVWAEPMRTGVSSLRSTITTFRTIAVSSVWRFPFTTLQLSKRSRTPSTN